MGDVDLADFTDDELAALKELVQAIANGGLDLAALKELAQAKANGGLNLDRRDALALLTGGAVGGGAALSAVGTAAAGASTSDSDGNVGTPTDRVDVFADGVDISDNMVDNNGGTLIQENVASGSVQLSSGSATVDTGISESTTATFYVALGPDTDDSEVAASIDANSSGNYEVHIDEINTSVGNPTVRYDIVRVR